MAEGWEQVPDGDLVAFLAAKGLGAQAAKIVEVTEAETVEELKLLDATMTEEVIAAAGLKIVSAQKFRLAVAELRADAEPVEVRNEPAEPAEPAGPEAPSEVVVLCIDRSGSMRASFREAAAWADAGDHVEQLKRTRMEAVKQMFYAFRDRTESLQRRHALGLLQFDNVVETMLSPSTQLDLFERIVDDVQPRGSTAIYSAIAQATEQLAAYRGKSSLRVVALTDGQNNSGETAAAALAAARDVGAVVDAIIVGDQPDGNLRRIVEATGGECWQIGDVTEGFELLEAESVVSIEARGGPRPVDPTLALDDVAETAVIQAAAVKVRRVEAAPVKVQDVQSALAAAPAPQGEGGAFLRRVAKELQQVAAGDLKVWLHSGEGVHIFPAEDDLSVWRCLIEGPADSPFEGGVFNVKVNIPKNYPFSAPQVRMETPIYHCNISESGQICMDLLYGSWSPNLTVPKVLEMIRQLLKTPDTDTALRQWVAEITLASRNSGGSDTRYVDEARAQTAQHAGTSVEEWKRLWTQ